MSKDIIKRIIDVQPGEVFEINPNSEHRSCVIYLSGSYLFLKIQNQKAVNLKDYSLIDYSDMPASITDEEVLVRPHPADSYLFVGGIMG